MSQTIYQAIILTCALIVSFSAIGNLVKFYIEGMRTDKSEYPTFIFIMTAIIWGLFWISTHLT